MVHLVEMEPSEGVKALSTEELRAEVERLRCLMQAAEARAKAAQSGPTPQHAENDSMAELELEEEPWCVTAGGDTTRHCVTGQPTDGRARPESERGAAPLHDAVTMQKLEFTNGDVYEGQVLNGSIRHGRGKHTCSTGDSYDGDWRDNQRHGTGVAVFVSGLRYEGAWKNDKADGEGACVYPGGDKFSGEWKNDHRWGWGRYDMVSGDTFEGQWCDDVIHGKGRYTYADGALYEGEYIEGQRSQGRYVSADGSSEYVGAWLDGMRHGMGTQHSSGLFKYKGLWHRDGRHGRGECVYCDGTVYDGEWVDDVQHGRGVCNSSNGDVYDGEWADNHMDGRGTLKYANGDAYVGSFKAGKRHGKGMLKGGDGSAYDGDWEQDGRHGTGAARLADGSVYQGEWSGNLRHGHGVCVFPDGRKFRGAWDAGVWVQSTADPLLSKVRGPGLARSVAGCSASFSIIARDEDRNPRLTGGDTWRVWLVPGRVEEASGGGARAAAEVCAPPADPACIHGDVADHGDGTYTATYKGTVAGVYTLYITTGEGEPVDDCPYPVRILPARPCPRRSRILGPGRSQAVAGQEQQLVVEGRDVYGNPCAGRLATELPITVTISAASGAAVVPQVEDMGKGAYVVTYTPPSAGLYRLEVVSGHTPVGDSPTSIHVTAAQHDDPDPPPQQRAPAQGVAESQAVPDLARKWAHIAEQEFRAIDGVASGFDSDEERVETPEQRFEREHPEVPVVRNLEDMWMVAKMQQEIKRREQQAAWEAEKARKLAERSDAAPTAAAPAEAAPHDSGEKVAG